MTESVCPLLPWDEASRLDALRALNLLDTPAEERFDRITRMACDLLQVPVALVSLVDAERQWFKSVQGTDLRETPRSASFCARAILQDDIFEIEDATADARFAANPLVTGAPFIRFYAGKPLYAGGKKVGTLCLIDVRPRRLSAQNRSRLADLAAWAEREINILASETEGLLRLEHSLRLAQVLEQAADAVFGIDEAGRIASANPAACHLFGRSAPLLLGRPLAELFAAADSSRARVTAQLQGRHSGQARLELTGLCQDGQSFALEASFSQIEVGRRRHSTAIMRDISERRQAERMKSEFIASVSHELRTPLTSILGALGMVKNAAAIGLKPEDTAELVNVAHLNSQRLNALINDILDVEKLDAGMMAFHSELLAVDDILNEACKLNRPFAQRLNVQLNLPASQPAWQVQADRMRLGQVLTNLISNACKFSPAGAAVTVSCTEKDGWLRIAVTDQGPGIPDEFRGQIFQRFSQAQPSRDNKQAGTGLGLWLARSMTEKMGGRIGFDSVAGAGSTFYIELPLASKAA